MREMREYPVRCCCNPDLVLGVLAARGDRLQIPLRREADWWSRPPDSKPFTLIELEVAKVGFVNACHHRPEPRTVTQRAWKNQDHPIDVLERIPGFRRIWWMRPVNFASQNT